MSKELLKDETLAEKFVKKGMWLYIFSFFIAPSGYIIKLLISNDLSVEEVWVIYSIIGFIWILASYNDLGFTESLQYFLPKFWINKQYSKFKSSIFLALWIQLITAILIAIWLWFGSDFLALNYFHSESAWIVLKIFSLWFIVFNIFSTIDNIFKSFQDTFSYRFIEFVRMWSIVLFVFIIFLIHRWSILTYSIAWFVWTLIWLLIAIIIFIKKYFYTIKKWSIQIDKKFTKNILSYSIWVVIASQASILLWQIDQQMIIYFLWAKQAGYYTNYLSLLSIYSILIWPIFGFLFPITTELAEKKEKWKLSMMLSMFVKYFWVFGLYWWVFVSLFWPAIAFVLFGTKFIPSWYLLQVGWLFIFFNILYSISFPILAWLGKIKQRVKILWIAAFINFILNLFLINYIWIIWAVISTIIGWFIMFVLSFQEIKKENIQINIDRKFILKNLVFALILWWFIYFWITKNLWFENRMLILEYILWSGLFYWVLILAFNFQSLKLFINEVKKVKNKC